MIGKTVREWLAINRGYAQIPASSGLESKSFVDAYCRDSLVIRRGVRLHRFFAKRVRNRIPWRYIGESLYGQWPRTRPNERPEWSLSSRKLSVGSMRVARPAPTAGAHG